MGSYLYFSEEVDVQAYRPRNHYHSDYELYYLADGCCRYFIGSRTYRLNPGDMVLIPPGVIHKVLYESESHSRMLINCTEDFIPPSVRPVLDRLTCFSGNAETSKQLMLIFQRFREAVKDRDEFYLDTLRCLAMQLFLLMAKASAAPRVSSGTFSFVENAIAYIHSNYMYRLSLTDTARSCAVSPEHLSRTFKKETGFGFSEYLTLYRLKKAEAMLKSGQSKSVAQVAMACGFSDSNYFSSAYKKYHGITPSKVRKTIQQEDDYV